MQREMKIKIKLMLNSLSKSYDIMIQIESKRKKRENILKKYPDAIIADVTSHAEDDLIKLSPFYPHGGIPVPFSEGVTATCVEAVWQGLKVFESADVDLKMFKNDSMKNKNVRFESLASHSDIAKV